MLERAAVRQGTRITFVLPPTDERAVSVVGDFNNWTPGVNTFQARKDGSQAVSVVLPKGQVNAFRYLADGGIWFDEEQADHFEGSNGYVHT